MEKLSIENEPLPVEVERPELEIAWRGLLYSVEAGYLTKDEAREKFIEWNNELEAGL